MITHKTQLAELRVVKMWVLNRVCTTINFTFDSNGNPSDCKRKLVNLLFAAHCLSWAVVPKVIVHGKQTQMAQETLIEQLNAEKNVLKLLCQENPILEIA
jgi:hypothetical protein